MAVEIAYVIEDNDSLIMEVRARMADHLSPEQSRILTEVLYDVFSPDPQGAGEGRHAEMFLDAKSVEGCTPQTIEFYAGELRRAFEFFAKPAPLVTAGDIRGLLAFMRKRGCSDVTLNNTRRVLSSFFCWMEDESLIKRSPCRKVKPVREVKRIKEAFSDEEVALLKEAARSAGSRPAVRQRNAAIVELLLTSGMRVGELVGVRRDDIDLGRREVTVFGKGQKFRVCYFSAEASLLISDYLGTREDDCPALFVSAQRRNGRCLPMKTGTVEVMIREIGRAAGVEGCHPHRFRRTMATRNLRRGMPLEEIQQLLGHEKLETTLIYAKTAQENVRNNALRLI